MTSLLDYLQTHDEAFRSRARLASLYSDFTSQRVTNPDGYHANSTAWLRALSLASKEGLLPAQTGAGAQHDRFTLHTGETLVRELQTPDLGRPLALSAVVQDAVKRKQLVPLKQFLEDKTSLYAKSWVPSAWDVVSWGLRQLGVLSEQGLVSDKLVAGNFVLIANVEAAAKAVLDMIVQDCPTPTSRIFTHDLFAQHLQTALGTPITSTDLSVLLIHLSRDLQALTTDPTTSTLKFASPNSNTPELITQEDTTTASLRTLIATLQPQITALETRITSLDLATRSAVKTSNLHAARTALKQKKLAESTLQTRTSTLLQLGEVYAKIEQARDQVEVVRVMEAAGHALRSLNEKTGGVERVQDVMDGLRESMQDVEEIGSVIGEGSVGQVDEGEVEDELEGLERAEREAREERERGEREAREEVERVERDKEEETGAEEVRKRLESLDQVREERKVGDAEAAVRESDKRVEENS